MDIVYNNVIVSTINWYSNSTYPNLTFKYVNDQI